MRCNRRERRKIWYLRIKEAILVSSNVVNFRSSIVDRDAVVNYAWDKARER